MEKNDKNYSAAEKFVIKRLKQRYLDSLKRRRVQGDLIGVFKVVKVFDKDDMNKVLVVDEQDTICSNG